MTSPKGPAIRNMWFNRVLPAADRQGIDNTGAKFYMRRVVSTLKPYDAIDPTWCTNPIFKHVFLSPTMVYHSHPSGISTDIDYEASVANKDLCFKIMEENRYLPKISFQSHVFMAIE